MASHFRVVSLVAPLMYWLVHTIGSSLSVYAFIGTGVSLLREICGLEMEGKRRIARFTIRLLEENE